MSKSKTKKATTRGRSRTTNKAKSTAIISPVVHRETAPGVIELGDELFGGLDQTETSKPVTNDSPMMSFDFSNISLPSDPSPQPSVAKRDRLSTTEPSRGQRRRTKSTISPVIFEEPVQVDIHEPSIKLSSAHDSSTPVTESNDAQVSLLSDFWVNLDHEETDKEEDRFNEFFEDSIQNSKSLTRSQEDSVSKRIQVGLYPSDAELLEELFTQSKAAGLKNVSRARILRVALRHFHTCWLNADQGT